MSSEPIPGLPGIDCQGGLKRCAGNAPFYRTLLLDFGERSESIAHNLAAAVSVGDLKKVHFLAHTLHGQAGNLGATELAGQARLLETQAGQQDGAAVARALPTLVDLLRATAEILKQGLLATADDRLPAPGWNEGHVKAARLAMSRLEVLLEGNDGESVESFQELLQACPQWERVGQLEQLQKLIYQFNFGEALKELRWVAKKLPQAVLPD